MGGKQSSTSGGGNAGRLRTYSNAGDGGMAVASNGATAGHLGVGGPGPSGVSARGRTRSLGSVQNGAHSGHLSIPTTNGGPHGGNISPDSDASTPEEGPLSTLPRGFMQHVQASSLPVHLFPFQGLFICLSSISNFFELKSVNVKNQLVLHV